MTKNANKPELLAPAGNLEKLKFAAAYGADAVYFGARFGSLRSFAGNFTPEQAQEGLDFLHARGKRGYLTLNIYPFSDEYGKLLETAKAFDALGIDGIIVADMGVFSQLKDAGIRAPLHVSTQANTTSAQAAIAWADWGARRVNLARELSLEQIRQIAAKAGNRIELEVFVHGALCFSYSGRCAISDYMTGHRANRGECKHPCRYRYALVEEKRPGQYYPVFEDERGLYLLNCKDLALFEYIEALKEAGVNSVKIEGRMKSIHYIATVVSLYRRILDGDVLPSDQALEWLNRVPNRGYTRGFIKGTFEPEDYSVHQSLTTATSLFVANVLEGPENASLLEVRNNIYAGDELELLCPDGTLRQVTMPDPLEDENANPLEKATNSQFVRCPEKLAPWSILRRLDKLDSKDSQNGEI